MSHPFLRHKSEYVEDTYFKHYFYLMHFIRLMFIWSRYRFVISKLILLLKVKRYFCVSLARVFIISRKVSN